MITLLWHRDPYKIVRQEKERSISRQEPQFGCQFQQKQKKELATAVREKHRRAQASTLEHVVHVLHGCSNQPIKKIRKSIYQSLQSHPL